MSKQTWLERLSAAIADRRWRDCPELIFRVLYHSLSDHQVSLAQDMLRRYLPIFERHWPGTEWPRTIVDHPADWVARSGRELPLEPSPDHLGDAGFLFALDGLLLGIAYRSQPRILTSSAVCAILEVIEAHASNAGPESAKLPPQGCAPCGGMATAKGKPAAQQSTQLTPADAARRLEWQHLLDEFQRCQLDPTINHLRDEDMERDLAAWMDHAMMLIVPEEALHSRRF